MTWSARARLFTGFVLVLVLVVGLSLMLNRRISHATSTTAVVDVGTYDVGSEYSGTVEDILVSEGDSVRAGEPIARVRSSALQRDIAKGDVDPTSFPGSVSPDGTITLLATEAGKVTTIATRVDSFVQGGTVLATVDVTGTEYVEATVRLDPRDYARIERGAPATITLPDRSTRAGQVESLTVTSEGGWAVAVLRVTSKDLAGQTDGILTAPGTPVVVSVELHHNGVISDTLTTMSQFLQRIGA